MYNACYVIYYSERIVPDAVRLVPERMQKGVPLMKKMTPKQIAALICVVLLVSMYLITFLVACLGGADSGRLFAACLTATIGLPIILWLFLWFYGLMKKRQSEAFSSLPDGETIRTDDKDRPGRSGQSHS